MTKLTDKPDSVESEWLCLFQFNSSLFCSDVLSSWADLADLLSWVILNDCIVALTHFEYSPRWCTYCMTKLTDKPASAEPEWLRLFQFNSSLFCSDALSSWAHLAELLLCVILNDCIVALTRFWIFTGVVYWQRYLIVTWLVPHRKAVVSAHVLCIPYSHAPDYRVTLFDATYVGCMCV